jgi:xanthine dehydrogenase accessory factor
MYKELELWRFVRDRLGREQSVMLLIVAESTGSSPGRQGYKMAVSTDGELAGSIGGGVMEVHLVEQSRAQLRPEVAKRSIIVDQVHRTNSTNASGMICSGEQTVIFKIVTPDDKTVINEIVDGVETRSGLWLSLTPYQIQVLPLSEGPLGNDFYHFEKKGETDFEYRERLGKKNDLFIIGGGHCSLALSELMSKMDFHISILDDRPDLNTIEKNKFADEISILDGYDRVDEVITAGDNVYVVVMTLGYASDEIVIRKLLKSPFRYFGVLGSKAKMATLLKKLRDEGLPSEALNRIRTPIGVPIGSHTPEEIAVSIAAEIVSVKNQ